MINLSASQKPWIDMAQVMTSTAEKMTQVSLQASNTLANNANAALTALTKTCFEGISNCYNVAETTAQQSTKTGSTTGK